MVEGHIIVSLDTGNISYVVTKEGSLWTLPTVKVVDMDSLRQSNAYRVIETIREKYIRGDIVQQSLRGRKLSDGRDSFYFFGILRGSKYHFANSQWKAMPLKKLDVRNTTPLLQKVLNIIR